MLACRYVLTGNSTYLHAMLSAWSMLRAHWIHVGGSIALNEGSYYPPDSYYIGFTGTHVSSNHHSHGHSHHHDDAAKNALASTSGGGSGDQYYHAPCMPGPGSISSDVSNSPHHQRHLTPQGDGSSYVSPLTALKADAMTPGPSSGGPNDGDPPTGEQHTHTKLLFSVLAPHTPCHTWRNRPSLDPF